MLLPLRGGGLWVQTWHWSHPWEQDTRGCSQRERVVTVSGNPDTEALDQGFVCYGGHTHAMQILQLALLFEFKIFSDISVIKSKHIK
jgi:hypothetical protein